MTDEKIIATIFINREAFFTRRTENVYSYYHIDEKWEEWIRCLDVSSLYPCINKYMIYTIRDPEILIGSNIP